MAYRHGAHSVCAIHLHCVWVSSSQIPSRVTISRLVQRLKGESSPT